MKTGVDTALVNVTSALSEFDSESQAAIQEVISSGLMEGFTTEAELLATRPTVLKKYAKAEDTKVIWFWNKPEGSPEGDYWATTGLSELDQAKEFTRERIDLRPLSRHKFSIQDRNGFAPLGITNEGVVETPKLEAGGALTIQRNIGPYSMAYTDKAGFMPFSIRKDGAVEIPKLVTNGDHNSFVSSKVLSIVDSDTIMHIGDSMTASHYCVQDKSHVSQLSQISPFRHINYGLSDDTLLRMQNRIITDTQNFGASLKSAKPKYLFIHSYANDRPFANVNIGYYQENMRRLIDTALAYGVQPVIVGYFFLDGALHQAVKSVADEYQIPVLWSDVLNKQIGFYNGATLFHEWHVGTRTNCLFWLPSLEYIKQQKPMRTLKIFRKRATFLPGVDNDLLYSGLTDRAKKWKEIGIGHYSLTHEYKYDELDDLPAEDRVWTYHEDEYTQLSKKVAISFADYCLIEIQFDAFAKNMEFVEINLAISGSPTFSVRDNISQSTAMPPNIAPTDQLYVDNFAKPRGNWAASNLH